MLGIELRSASVLFQNLTDRHLHAQPGEIPARFAELHTANSQLYVQFILLCLFWLTLWSTPSVPDAYDTEQLVIKWMPHSGAIMTNPEIRMPDMRLRRIKPGLTNTTYATGQ